VKQVTLHEEALMEMGAAKDYYEEKKSGLGDEFLVEVENALASVASNPQAFGFYRSTKFRKRLVKRFPYLVIYRERTQDVWVLAIAHTKRKPGYWSHRARALS
jgi:toxin ParE1/3/4